MDFAYSLGITKDPQSLSCEAWGRELGQGACCHRFLFSGTLLSLSGQLVWGFLFLQAGWHPDLEEAWLVREGMWVAIRRP